MSLATTLLTFPVTSLVTCFVTTSQSQMCSAPQRKRFDPPKVRRRFTLRSQAPRHSQSDSIHLKRAEGSLCDLRTRTAPQREARATRPTQSAQRVHFAISKREPRHSEPTHPKHAEGRHSESNSTHPNSGEGSLCGLQMCTAPERPAQSAAPATKFDTQARKYYACHEICTKSSKALRPQRNLHEKL